MRKQTNTIRVMTLSMCLLLTAFLTGCPSGDTDPGTDPPVDENPPTDGVSVSVSPARAVLPVGQVLKLEATSSGAKKEDYVWSSNNLSVATVDQSGTVRGVSGSSSEVTITATGSKSKKGGRSRVIIAEVTVSSAGAPLAIGATKKLTASSTYSGDSSFEWASNNTAIATVSSSGTVTAVSAGTATITATGSVSRATGSQQVTAARVTVSSSGEPLSIGWSEQFNVSSTYAGDTSFTWESSNSSVASVSSNGTVTAVALGSATITATGNGSGFSGSQQVTVVGENDSMLIWNGEVSFTGEYGALNNAVPFRGSACFEGTPDPWHSPSIALQNLPSWQADISGYDEIWFFAKANATGKSINFQLGGWPWASNSINVAPYIDGGVLDTTYRLVRVPIPTLKTADYDLSKVESLYFGTSSSDHSIFVDEIWAINLNNVDPSQVPLMGPLPEQRFGDVAANNSVVLTVPVTNLGAVPLEVSEVSLAGANVSQFSVSPAAFTVAPSGTHNLNVTFAPTCSGQKTAVCYLIHNITALGAVSQLSLTGNGVAPTIALSETTLDFGAVPLGGNVKYKVTITNSGNATLNVNSIESSSGAFGASPGSLQLAGGSSEVVEFWFAPTSTGAFTDDIILASNDPLRPEIRIGVTGRGLSAGQLGELSVKKGSVSSSTVSIGWGQLNGLDSVRVYIAPEPSSGIQEPLPGQILWATLPGNTVDYTLTGLAASVDVFIRVEGRIGQNVVASGRCHARTLGGPTASLDNQLREVHLLAPNILMLVLTDEIVESYAGSTGSLIGDTGPEWQAPAQWSIARSNQSPITVSSVYRHSVPVGNPVFEDLGVPNHANVEQAFGFFGEYITVDHRIFLVLNQPIGNREVLTVTGPRGLSFVVPYSDLYLETPVIQVNQVGYSPIATERYAYVSGWMGDGGPLSLGSFPSAAEVIYDNPDSLTVRTAALSNLPITLRSVHDPNADTEVREINLAALPAAEGVVYRVRIPGVGVSWPTQVSHTAVFKAFYTVARGLYFNRWGRDLRTDSTEFGPRPPDHSTVYTAEKTEWGYVGDVYFARDTPRTGARQLQGGHHDAGDWDIQMIHYQMPLTLMRAYELNPEAFTDGQLTIPESGNGIPDILDEVLWSLAAWEQLQEADGGVRAGVESYGHPPAQYFADLDSMPYWTYSRSAHHSARVAGLFAWAARLVSQFDPAKSAELTQKAIQAYNYAIGHGVDVESAGTLAFASGELFRTTADPTYAAAYDATMNRWKAQYYDILDIKFVMPAQYQIFGETAVSLSPDLILGYVLSGNADPGKWYFTAIRDGLTRLSDEAVETVSGANAFRNGRPVGYPSAWGTGTAVGEYMLSVYALLQLGGLTPTQVQDYYNAISLSADYSLGCNENGMVYITELGSRFPNYPLHIDAMTFYFNGYGRMPGITVFGPTYDLPGASYYDYGENVFYPAFMEQPLMRRYGDLHSFVTNNEGGFILNGFYTELFGTLLPSGLQPPDTWLPWGKEHRNTLAPREDASSQ